MEYSQYSRVDITLNGQAEIDTFKTLVSLAVRQLQRSPVRTTHGTPLKSQAGIKGVDLINLKKMLERLAAQFGWDAPRLEPAPDIEEMPQEVAELMKILRGAGLDISVTKLSL